MDSTAKSQKIEIRNVKERPGGDMIQFSLFGEDDNDFNRQVDELLVENEFEKVYILKRSKTTWDCWFVP